jgi:hypothetical protein
MCFGPSKQVQQTTNQAAAEQQVQADEVVQEAVQERATKKVANITEALAAKTQRAGTRGGSGRRSLFSSSTTAGFLGRFL